MIKKLISEKDINKRVKELSELLYKKYCDDEVVFICTLKGAVFFACELLKNYKGDARLEFLRVSSYSGKNSSGKIELNLSISKDNIENKNVIIVEDIVDTGSTLKFLKEYIGNMNPNSVKICTLLNKEERRKVEIEADYVGFEIENKFIVGYGMDYNEKCRNLPYVGYVE